MRYLKRAAISTRTSGQLVFLIAGNIVAINLTFVARFAEVGVAPAEPLRDRTTELALEFYIVSTVDLAILDTCSDTYCGAFRANKLFRFVFLPFLLSPKAIFQAAKIGALAFETLIVGKFEHRESL